MVNTKRTLFSLWLLNYLSPATSVTTFHNQHSHKKQKVALLKVQPSENIINQSITSKEDTNSFHPQAYQ